MGLPVLRPQNSFYLLTSLSSSLYYLPVSLPPSNPFIRLDPPPYQWPSCNWFWGRKFIPLTPSIFENYSRYWYAYFFIRFRVSRLFQRSIWRQSERICDVKLTFDDVILTISRNYPWPVMTSSLYRSLMSWNHVSINYSGTVTDIDLRFFSWHSLNQGGSDEPKLRLLSTGSQEE